MTLKIRDHFWTVFKGEWVRKTACGILVSHWGSSVRRCQNVRAAAAVGCGPRCWCGQRKLGENQEKRHSGAAEKFGGYRRGQVRAERLRAPFVEKSPVWLHNPSWGHSVGPLPFQRKNIPLRLSLPLQKGRKRNGNFNGGPLDPGSQKPRAPPSRLIWNVPQTCHLDFRNGYQF